MTNEAKLKTIRFLREKADQMEREMEQEQNVVDAYKNAYEQHFDGLKLIANADDPFTLVLPMAVKANMFYAYEEATYVAVADGIVTADNFGEMLERW